MLQTIRDKPWIAFALLVPIIVTMAFFGINDYFSPNNETFAARITGPAKGPEFLGWGAQTRDISQEDFRRRFEQYRSDRREQEGDAFDSANFDNLDNKRRVLDVMVDEELAALAAERDGITVSEAQVAEELKKLPEFQVNNAYSADQYRLTLAAQQLTHAQYMANMRAQMSRRALPMEIIDTAFASTAEVESLLRLSQQTRDLELIDLPTPSLPPEAPAAADLQAWYDGHASAYRTEEQVAIEYIELDMAAMPAVEAPDDATLQARYAEQKSRYVTAPTRSAAHLLIAVPADADATADTAAHAKAMAMAEAARVPGADFAALVAENSDDLGSKAEGGELGVVGDSDFPAEFVQALNGLTEVGQISEPVRTTEGWHVVRLSALTPGSERSFAEVRAELAAEYMATEQERRFSELAARVLEQIYKTPTALAPAAEAVGLPVQRSALFTRGAGEGIAAIEDVRRAAFNDEQRIERKVSDTLEIAPGHVVALHVIEHKPEAAIPFADVQDRVLNDYNADRLAKASLAQAEALLARVRGGETLEALATELGKTVTPLPGIGRQGPMPPDMVQAVFSTPAPAEGGRSYGIAALGGDRHVLFALTKVTPGDLTTLDEPTRTMLVEQIARNRGIVEFQEYIKSLRGYYKVVVAEDRL